MPSNIRWGGGPSQVPSHLFDERIVARMHCIAGEGLWQQYDVLEVDNAHLAILVNEEVALVHVGLNEDELVVAETYLRWLASH